MLASSAEIDRLCEAQLREFTAALVQELALKQALIDRLTHEMAIIKRLRVAWRLICACWLWPPKRPSPRTHAG